MRIEPTRVEAHPGERVVVRALGLAADGRAQDLTRSVLWTSRDHRTAAVDREGGIQGGDLGSTTVYAILGTLVAELSVHVV